MSAYSKNKTIYRDRECLLLALASQGYTKEMVEIHEGVGSQLIDYCGRPTHYLDPTGDKANIIVRRKNVGGAANDLGFKKSADGTYDAIVSAYDTGKHNTKWFNQLKAVYTEAVSNKEAKRQGLKPYKTTVLANGKKLVQYLAA
jgi:hypothetical protein